MNWLDTVNTIEDLPTGQLEPGRFIWLHGLKQARTPGVFYAKETEFSAAPVGGWSLDNRFDNERGYSAPALRIAIIGTRTQWFIPGLEGKAPTYLPRYESGAKKHLEVLCMIDGLDDPMVFSASGMNKAKPMQDIIKIYNDGLLKQASRIARRALPPWSFWLPIRNRELSGKTEYIEAKDASGKSYGSVVTPPALYLPDDAMETLFVGADIIRRGAEVREVFASWFEIRRRTPDVIEGEVLPALPAPKNAPQPVGEDELF